jgi:glycosyltransferase involved in cell wall biosynthesis
MTAAPEVSVVMSVFNGGSSLARTVESVLTQSGVSLELIVVDDGSTDETARVLAAAAARDPRVRVLPQANEGLTRSLVTGCDAAVGEFIARQDAGDISLPGRLEKQCAVLRRSPTTVLVSCFTRSVGVYGEVVHESCVTAAELRAGLRAESLETLRGPSRHGTVMMRGDAYRRVGGYRPAFPVAQDIDLWLRLAEIGDVDVVPDVLYEADLSPDSITARRRSDQVAYARLALRAAAARRNGRGDAEIVSEVTTQSPLPRLALHESAAWRTAAFLYSVGRGHGRRDPEMARRYYRAALRSCPWHWRSLAALMTVGFSR